MQSSIFQSEGTSILSRSVFRLLGAVLVATLLLVPSPLSLAQSTYTCGSGQWDILQLMRMQTTWADAHYYLKGKALDGSNVLIFQAASDVQHDTKGQWIGGKQNYIKNYALPPASPPDPQDKCDSNCGSYAPPEMVPNATMNDTPEYWGYPADVDLFDGTYIYLWITETDWNNPYSFKKFNSGNSDYSYRFAPRCGVPGQITLQNPVPAAYPKDPPTKPSSPSTAFEILPANVYTSNGLIDSSNETFTSADCKNPPKWDQLGYSYTQVNAPVGSPGFAMNDTVNRQQRTLTYVPIVYWYNCDSGYLNCANHEEFDYGYYPATGDYYGLVQWLHFTKTNPQPDQAATFNEMDQYTGIGDGHFDDSNINYPAPACFQ